MKTTRRDFIRNSVLTGVGMAASSTLLSAANFYSFRPEIQLGVCASLDNAAFLSSIGFTYIEEGVQRFLVPDKTGEEFKRNLDLAASLKIPVKACNSFLPGKLKCVGPDRNHDAVLKYAETAFIRAQQAGIDIIVFGSGAARAIPDGVEYDNAREQFIELCEKMAPIASEHHVTVVLEPLNKKEVNFINSVAEGGEIVNAVNHKGFRLLADLYHMKMENESPESILKYGRLLHHVHVAEKEGRSAPGTYGEDFSGYLKALGKVGYKKRISIECRWQDMEKQAKLALDTMKKQLSQI